MNFYEYNASRIIPDNLVDSIIDTEQNVIKEINSLSKINIIVGPNNSGKSYIIRELFKEPANPIYLSQIYLTKLNISINIYIEEFKSIFKNILSTEEFSRISEYVIRQESIRIEENEGLRFFISLMKNWANIKNIVNIINMLTELSVLKRVLEEHENSTYIIGRDTIIPLQYKIQLQEWMKKVENNVILPSSNYINNSTTKFKHIYIHYLRTIGKYGLSNVSLVSGISKSYDFKGTYREELSDENDKKKSKYFDGWIKETGMDLYTQFGEMNKSVKTRKILEEFEIFLSMQFFEGKEVLIVAAEQIPAYINTKEATPEIKNSRAIVNEFEIQIGIEKPQPIHNLGTGVQMIIILTWFMFEFDAGIVFIEEPELFVHPSMQKQLMDIYDRHPRSENFQFFITTHSNHIIDYAQYSSNVGMISINKIVVDKDKQDAETKFMLTQHEKVELELLNSLGVTNSSLFISNCTIWVEGITDYEYLSKFFELYQYTKDIDQRYKIDLHFGFLEYGGSLIEHWMFKDEKLSPEEKSKAKKQIRAKNISNRILVISDQDENKDDKHHRLTQELGDDYYFLPCREIENILSPQIIVSIVEKIEKKTLPHLEKAIAGMGALGKLSEVIAINLPEIIKDETTGETQVIKYFAESQGKRGKRTFCSKAISIIDKKIENLNLIKNNRVLKREELNEVMRDYTWKVCDKMYDFITKHNP